MGETPVVLPGLVFQPLQEQGGLRCKTHGRLHVGQGCLSTIRESLDGYIESCDFDNPEPWLSSHLRGVWAA